MKKDDIDYNKYQRIHYWLRKKYSLIKKCETVGCPSKGRIEWALKHGKEYKFNRDNFLMLCKSCHTKYDFTEETKLKISQSHIGKKHSEETRIKMGLGNKGKLMPMLYKKVNLYKDGKLIKKFESVTKASK